MGNPSTYAQVVPRLRYLKSTLIHSDKIRELSPPITDIYASLRETKYKSVSETKNSEEAEKEVIKQFYLSIDDISSFVPKEAINLTLAFAREDEIHDALIILRSIVDGREVSRGNLLSLLWSQSSLNKILAEPDSTAGIQRFVELSVNYKHIYNPLKEALNLFNESKDTNVITWYYLAAISNLYSDSLNDLSGIDKDYTQRIICPIMEGRIALGLIQASMLKLPLRILDLALSKINICNISWLKVSSIYERESSDPIALGTSLKDLFKYITIEGRKEIEIMESIRKSSALVAKRNSEIAYQSYPFSPSLIASSLTLLKFEVNNIRSIITSSYLKLNKDEYEPLLIL
ncbi:MAG: V-type ATPase subunit [Caldisphaera sp.]|nr:V-type ATPase subunit [Caldisphaera sp.]PMP90192.1 MAG: hypothetical protein C0171_05715 [Caldisphaera sp.]